jgi:hypothetical protein
MAWRNSSRPRSLVQRRQPFPRVDHEDDFSRRRQGQVDFAGDGVAEPLAVLEADSARVDQGQAMPVPARAGHEPVAGRARSVENERNVASGQAVEEGGLPDIRASDNRDGVFHESTSVAAVHHPAL